MMDNPAQFENDEPDLSAEDIVDLHETFYLMEPLEEWRGRWVLEVNLWPLFQLWYMCTQRDNVTTPL